ncbi:conserved hypothetical protein, partial [Ricinus communis]
VTRRIESQFISYCNCTPAPYTSTPRPHRNDRAAGGRGVQFNHQGSFSMRRFDDSSFGHGWFQAAYSEDLRKGHVQPLTAMGREFVLWRDMQGQAHAMDAHCPHLGTHLGHGGRVCGTSLRCPFHGWQFAGDGACTDIPYSPNPRLEMRHLKSWPLVERNGLVMVWWHPRGIAPTFEVPAMPEHGDAQWSRYRRQRWE